MNGIKLMRIGGVWWVYRPHNAGPPINDGRCWREFERRDDAETFAIGVLTRERAVA